MSFVESIYYWRGRLFFLLLVTVSAHKSLLSLSFPCKERRENFEDFYFLFIIFLWQETPHKPLVCNIKQINWQMSFVYRFQ